MLHRAKAYVSRLLGSKSLNPETALAQRWQGSLTAGAWAPILLGSAHPAENHSQLSLCLPIPPKDSFLTAQHLGRQFRDVTETGCCPLGAVVQQLLWLWSYRGLHDGTTVHCLLGSTGHPFSSVIARGLTRDVNLLHLLHHSPGPYLIAILTRAPGPSNFSDN